MREIRADVEIHHPRDVVYVAYRDRLEDLVPYLPNVDVVKVLRSEREGTELHVTNRWTASAPIPGIARKVIKPEMLSWRDFAVWRDEAWCCDWRIENPLLPRQVRVEGRNTFVELGHDRCRFEIRGELEIDGAGLPGVPRVVGRRISPHVERFVVALIEPNLVKTADGVGRFLSESG